MLAASVLWFWAPIASADHGAPHVGSGIDETDGFEVGLIEGDVQVGDEATSGTTSSGVEMQYIRHHFCHSTMVIRQDLNFDCPNNDPIIETCDGGIEALPPVWRRTRQPGNTNWSGWQAITGYQCLNDAARRAMILEEWDSLRPTSPEINVQPDTGWVYASVPTIFYIDSNPIIHHTRLIGVDVRIRATPVNYHWDWGEGHGATNTMKTGAPYPHHNLTHTYLHYEGDTVVNLTTTWAGDYSLNGGSWVDIDGTITTSSAPVPLDVHNPKSHLVDCDVNGQCQSGLSGPSR